MWEPLELRYAESAPPSLLPFCPPSPPSPQAALCSSKLLLHCLSALRAPPQQQQQQRLLLAPPSPYGAPRQGYSPEARTLFPATPAPKAAAGGGGSSLSPPSLLLSPASASAASASSSEAIVSACLPLTSLLATWLRGLASGNLGQCNAQAILQVSDSLCSSALLALQLSRTQLQAAGSVGTLRAVQGVMLDALPHLCR